MSARPAPSGVAVYRTGIGPATGTASRWPPARDCPVVVVNVYTYPGRSSASKAPLTGMMSPRRMNWPAPRRLVLHTCTTRAGRPPVTWTVICCAAVDTEVCATIDQAERPGAVRPGRVAPAWSGELSGLRDHPGQGRDAVVAVPGAVSPDQAAVLVREIRRDRVDERPHQDAGDPGLAVGIVQRAGQASWPGERGVGSGGGCGP